MYLRARSAAQLLDLPLSTFYQLVRQGSLPPAVSQLGKHRLWSREQLVAAVDPRGYKAAHEHQAAAGGTQADKAVRPRAVCLSDWERNLFRRASREAAGRSPYAGILGGAGDSSPLLGFSGSAVGLASDRRDG